MYCILYGSVQDIIIRLKPGSEYDARVCIAKCEKYSSFSEFFVTRHKNVTQRNVWIESESILALLCITMSVNAKAMQCNACPYIIL